MTPGKYIGITIGPVFDTMNMSSSPLAIWASSFVFSVLSKTLCRLIVENGANEEDIVSPYYSKENPLLDQSRGVGLFHDRIIFTANDFDIGKMDAIKDAAVCEISKLLGISKEYMKQYIMISYAPFEAYNPIADSAELMDCLELAKPYVFEDDSSLLKLFMGKGNSHNSELEKTALVQTAPGLQLKNADGSYKLIEDIVTTGQGFKKYRYYAIVRADGDNMSKIIGSLTSDGEIRDFSEICLGYCSEIANLVKTYGGITIYSGGDDLLAILPCETKDGKTPFEFANEANGVFKKAFEKYNKPVSLSFGITMAYYKFPLYEALEDSRLLLYDIAKRPDCYLLDGDEKNRMAIRLKKHSGQSEGLIISNEFVGEFIKLLNDIKRKNTESDDVLFVMHKFTLFESIFNNAADEQQIKNTVENIFDADEHKQSSFINYNLIGFMTDLKQQAKIALLNDGGSNADNYAKIMNYTLRICKFFVEKGGEE